MATENFQLLLTSGKRQSWRVGSIRSHCCEREPAPRSDMACNTSCPTAQARWMPPVRRSLVVAVALLLTAGCADVEGLAPIADADRIEIGALKLMPVLAVVSEPSAVARAVDYANLHRAGRWSTVPVKHGCRSIALSFFRGKERLGYLAWEPTDSLDESVGALFTDGAEGQVRKIASAEDTSKFRALLPANFKPHDCGRR